MISTNPTTKDCVPDPKTIAENSLLLTPLLRLAPPPEAHVELPSIDISEYFSGQSISLNAFEMRKGVKKEEPEVKTEKSPIKEETETKSVTSVVDEAVNTILSLQVQPKTETNVTNPKKDISTEEKQTRIEQIKQGWTLENCSSLTIGEIYLMVIFISLIGSITV